MTKKISISIYIDGTGNNKTNDAPKGMETNVARIYDMQDTDVAYDFSKNGSNSSEKFDEGLEGNMDALETYLQRSQAIENGDDTISMKIYHDGVGSQKDQNSFEAKWEGATGSGSGDRVKIMADVVKGLRKAYGPDTEIEINVIAFSRGYAAGKDLLNKVADFKDPNIQLKAVVGFDTVAAIGDATCGVHPGMDLRYPAALADENSAIYEPIAANEYRETFKLVPYQNEKVDNQFFPGSHAQIGGGYFNDILAVGPLVSALNYLEENAGPEFVLKMLPVDDVVKLRLYNAIIDNPYLVRALLVDSRVKSEDLSTPGQIVVDGEIVKNDPFVGESVGNDGEFDIHPNPRGIIDERKENSYDPFSKIVFNIGNGISKLFDSDFFYSEQNRANELLEKYAGGGVSISGIDQHNYQPVHSLIAMDSLPPELESAVSAFEARLKQIEYDPEKLDDPGQLQSVIDQIQETARDFAEELDNLEAISGYDEKTIEFLDSLQRNSETIENRVQYFENRAKKEAEEIKNQTDEKIVAAENQSYVELVSSWDALRQAIADGDGLEIAQAIADHLRNGENFGDSTDPKNAVNKRQGNPDGENAGLFSEQSEAILRLISTGFSFAEAIEDDNTLQTIASAVKLVGDIDNYLDTKALYDDDPSTTADNTGLNNYQKHLASMAGSILGLACAIESGDDLQIAVSSVNLLYQTTGHTAFGAAGSALGLAINVNRLDDAIDSGDTGAIASATLSTAYSALSTYNAAAKILGYSQVGGSSMPAIGCAIGIAQGLFAIADGDVQGGSEQIALSIAMYALYCIPVYGWAIALALQVASATRNCDGQIIDTENIEEFTDNIAPAGEEAAHAAIVSIEKPAEWGNDIYEDNIYYSGYNVEMLAEIGVDIPDDLQGAFGFCQMNAEFSNPLRYAHYFEDLDEMSLADIWDSLYISQSLAATIAVFYKKKEPPQASVSFTLNENGQVAISVGGDARMRETANSCASSVAGVMGYYQAGGGRLMIDGNLPSLTLVRGEDSTISYRSETGGKVTVVVEDMAHIQEQMVGVLYARDRGERLDSAIEISRDSLGEIDLAKVDVIMAGFGFGKTGITYTYGETKELIGVSFGSGVFKGGGNVGPQGQHFVARDQDIKSLPLRDDQRPSQTMGEIIKIVGLNNAFAGAGAELLAMAMMSGGLLGLAAPTGAAPIIETDGDWIRPLDRLELEKYLQNPRQSGEETAEKESGNALPMPALTDPTQMQHFLEEHWGELLRNPANFTKIPDSAYFYRQLIGFDGLRSDGTRPGWIGSSRWDDPLLRQPTAPQVQFAADDEHKNGHLPGESFTGYRVHTESLTLGASGSASDPLPEPGLVFNMAEDSTLRFLLSELIGDTTPGSYGKIEENCSFVSFGRVENGRIYQEANGDIRFEPTPGFVGTGSFSYTLKNSAGDLIEKHATVHVQNVNDTPLLQDDKFTLEEGEPFYLDSLLANDFDPDGDPLTLDHLRGLEHGKVSIVNGRLAFIPEEGYFGDIEFSYWVRDHAFAYPVMATATLTYLDRNTGVSTGDDRFIVLEDHSLTISVDKLLENDVEHDGENITFTGLGAAVHGTVHRQPDGTILFTPEPDYAGTGAGFSYSVEDDSGNSSTGWVSVEVLDVREAPLVIAGTRAPILEDEILTFTPEEIAGFIYDADGDVLHLDFITNVVGGEIVTANGYYSFIPDRNFSGHASFDYRANDNHRGVVDGHLEFEILSVNDPIETGEDILDTEEDTPVTVHVDELLANDSDVDGSVFTFVALGKSAFGSAILNPDNTVVFTPDPDYTGIEAGFEYLVQDSEGLQSIGWVQVRVSNVNDAPEIIGQSLSLLEDQPLTFDAATLTKFVRDADNDELRITGVEAVSGGTVDEVDSVYTFIPDHNYHGGGLISLTVTDGKGESVATTLALDILSIDDPAVLGEDILTTLEEQSVNTNIAALLANDQDADGPLEFVGLGRVFHGTVLADDQGEIQFNPDKDYFGKEAGFEYIVKDPDGYEATGRVRIHVENVNDAPRIIGNTLRSDEGQPIVFNAATIAGFIADLDGDEITLTSVDDVSGGTLENKSGIYTFIPDKDYHGPAFLRYSAEDGHGGQVSGELNLEILSVDDPTIFGDNTFTTKEEQLLVTSIAELLKGDHDADGPLEFMGVGEARHGEVKVVAGGGIEFMPVPDYFGDEAGFSYVVRDEEGYQATGWVTVKVENINDEPEIIANRLHLREDQSIIFTEEEVAKFLFDADGDFLHLDMVANVTGGRMEQNGNIYTFIPEDNFYGEASFDYLATNSSGEQIAGGLSIAISPVNDLPSTTYFSTAGTEDNEVTMTVADLMAGATDIEDGTNLQFAGIDSSLHGDVYVDDGLVHFLPDKDFFGNAFFSYNVVDSEGGVGRGYVGIEIVGENDIPVAVDDKRIVAWSNDCYQNVYMASTLLANDYDVDGDPIKLIATGAAEYGTVSLDGEGIIHYIASSDGWVGVDRFSYQISDGNGGFATGIAEIDVKINTSPDVYSELLFTEEDIISILSQNDLLANDSDIDGDSLRIIAVDQAEHCSVSLLADGSLQFVPELNYNNNYPGQASFRYTVTDGISEPVTSVAFFDIDPVNDKPILSAERIEGAVEDNSFSFTVAQIMANDTDVEMMSAYEEDSISFAGVWGAGHGSISWDVGSGIIYYTPDADFCGVETFNYMVVDSYGAESTITSEIYVLPVNDYPVVQEDIGSMAEDSIWNYYSIGGLLANDYDVDGDSLTAINPFVIEGRADVQISGDNLMVKPGFREDRVVIGYTVSDGHGGDVTSKLTIPNIREHNYAPTFSGIYSIGWKNSYTVWFNFHAEDRNGGNTWGESGDIVSISASALNVGSITDEGYTFKFKGDTENAALVLTAVDQAGATGSIYVRISNLSKVDGNYHYCPVVLDLDGDGIELLDLSAGVQFDWNLDGESERTGWVGKDDGFLVYDYDHNRVVNYANELALKEYDPEATTDLEGLRAFDTNKDGAFDNEDAEWGSFGVWQDKNSDGKTDEGEFATLDELEIRSVDLQSDENYRELDGNIVYGSTTYQKMDGTTGVVGDVGLNGESLLFTEAEDFTGIDMPEEEDSPGESVGESPGEEPELLAEPPASQDITAPEEENEQGLETESLTTVESEELEETEEVLPFDDAEINRQCLQLLSDIAGCSECEPIALSSFLIDDIVPEHIAPAIEIEQDFLEIA